MDLAVNLSQLLLLFLAFVGIHFIGLRLCSRYIKIFATLDSNAQGRYVAVIFYAVASTPVLCISIWIIIHYWDTPFTIYLDSQRNVGLSAASIMLSFHAYEMYMTKLQPFMLIHHLLVIAV